MMIIDVIRILVEFCGQFKELALPDGIHSVVIVEKDEISWTNSLFWSTIVIKFKLYLM